MLREKLMLASFLETPAFVKGRQAFDRGESAEANQFKEETALRADWVLGWSEGRYAEAANKNRQVAERYAEKTPFEMGRLSARDGLTANANPFHHGAVAHEQWRLGWAKAKSAGV